MSYASQRRARLDRELKLNVIRPAIDIGPHLPYIAPASLKDIMQREANRPMTGHEAFLKAQHDLALAHPLIPDFWR